MITQIETTNFGPLSKLHWKNLGKINLVIGGNGSGKTFLLKVLYTVMRTIEEYRRGDDQRTAEEILADKLYWTFQTDKIGDLISKGSESGLKCTVSFNKRDFTFKFGKDAIKQISIENHAEPRISNSIFLPAKEVLSIHNIILKSREQDHVFGFDDTYLDLARALRQSTKGGKNYKQFSEARTNLEQIIDGKVELDDKSGRWIFKKSNNQKYYIGVTAEGVKKISILDTLLGNRYLDDNSIIFIDEPESALHPIAISKLLDIIYTLTESGVQVFLASHSYFVIKKLYLIAQEKKISIPIASVEDNKWVLDDLKNGLPNNPIVNESINLYKQEVKLGLE
jgi:AAA15 family ATPase/GTPase